MEKDQPNGQPDGTSTTTSTVEPTDTLPSTSTLSHAAAIAETEKARREAAERRVALRNKDAELATLKATTVPKADLEAAHKRIVELEMDNITKTYDLPKELLPALAGLTGAELEARAKLLSEHAGKSGGNGSPPRGGLTPNANEDLSGMNPRALLKKLRGK